MIKRFIQLAESPKIRNSLTIIVLAAVILLLITALQYNHSRRMLEDELEHRAENELTFKAVLIKGMLNGTEKTLRGDAWYVRDCLETPDSLYEVFVPIVMSHPDVLNCAMAFVPDYYPDRGRLFEPFAKVEGSHAVTRQIAGPDHDYTRMDFYRQALDLDALYWSDPYPDSNGSGSLITSCSMPVSDGGGKVAGVFVFDVSLDWLSDTLNARHAYPSSFDLLLTEGGELICHPGDTIPHAADVAQAVQLINDSTVARVDSKSGRSKMIDFCSWADGSKGYIYYANMRGKPHWQLAIVCYDSEVYAKAGGIRNIMLWSMLAALAILGMIVSLFARNERRLHLAGIRQERIASELRIAAGLQASMLPRTNEELSRRQDIAVSGSLAPAVEVGGDLYDYFVSDEKLFFCIGDVSGKGVPSSLVAAVVHVVFYTTAEHESNPAMIMRELNKAVCRNNDENMFVTFFIGVLDLPTGRLRYCNAGHDAPLLIGDTVARLPAQANLPIGVLDDVKYVTQETVLAPGTTMFLYTDGLTEAMDKQHNQLGLPRVMDALNHKRGQGAVEPQELLMAMGQLVNEFADGAPQSDDLTLLAVRYTPIATVAVLDKTLELTANVERVPELNRFIEQVAQEIGLNEAVMQQVKLAVEEVAVNVMNYAYPPGNDGSLRVKATFDGQSLAVAIIDEGKPFDPTLTTRPDTTATVEERPIGGLGILLAREMMDSINYERIDGQNILTLRKKAKQ